MRRTALYLAAVGRLIARLVWELLRYLGLTAAGGAAQVAGVALLIALIPLAVLAFGVYLRVVLLVVVVAALLGVGFAGRGSRADGPRLSLTCECAPGAELRVSDTGGAS